MTLSLLAIAWVAGIYLGARLDLSQPAIGLFLSASVLLLALLVSARRSLLPALLVVALLVSVLRVEIFGGDQTSSLAAYHSRLPIQVEGVVVRDPEATGPFTRLRLRVDRLNAAHEWVEVQGDVLVTLRESSELVRLRDPPYFRYGDRLLLEGPLEAPEELEDFDYPAFLARQGIGSVVPFPEATLLEEGQGAAFYSWLYGVRRRVSDSLGRVVPEPQASLGQALLLGLRDNLPEELVEDFRATGTSHVLAISGLHVGILLGIALALSRRVLGRRHYIYLVLPLLLMWLYALISGMSPSVTRAAIMGSVYIAALLLGRPRSVLPALGLAAAVMVTIAPNTLWSVSFQLSFAAMAGIAVLSEPLSRRLQMIWTGRLRASDPLLGAELPAGWATVSDIVAMTIAATVATLPLIAFYFQRVSLVGLPHHGSGASGAAAGAGDPGGGRTPGPAEHCCGTALRLAGVGYDFVPHRGSWHRGQNSGGVRGNRQGRAMARVGLLRLLFAVLRNGQGWLDMATGVAEGLGLVPAAADGGERRFLVGYRPRHLPGRAFVDSRAISPRPQAARYLR